jgi:hypothetical protein
MTHNELIDRVAAALLDEWPALATVASPTEVAALAVEVYEELEGEVE